MRKKVYIAWTKVWLFYCLNQGLSVSIALGQIPEVPPIALPTYKHSIQAISDNDFFSLGPWTDRYYSFGSFIQYRQYISPDHGIGNLLYTAHPRKTQRIIWGFGIAQEGYTAGNIEEAEHISELDRPHAGWLYVKPELVLVQKKQLWQISAEVGVVGPLSGAEQSQRFVHKLLAMPLPQGWENQIPNRFAMNLRIDWIRSLYSSPYFEILSEVSGQAGRESSFLRPGMRIRLGSMYSFKRSITYQTGLGAKPGQKLNKWEIFWDLEAHAQILANHATVHGGDWDALSGAFWQLRHYGYGLSSGVQINHPRFGLRYAMHFSQGEVQGLETHRYGSIQLTYRF